ncbi:estradiol 17-beta-dehydrogenase [Thraustotheca clavata]|uniref:Estradiol 17-beta-dehydrogenase n=1 Tax=Thraustotheca clavata TaxID=74557 RepID=A0A1W0A389_9STRA|nr:estradiol 17-beta-dehydrogenase [Thraustotheca clavata]
MLSNVELIIKAIGVAVIAKVALTILSSFYAFFLRPGKKLTKYGKWAIVTGATDGIGKATALELARKGLNVALISRTQSKLDEAAAEIVGKYSNVQVKTLALDCNNLDEKACEKVRQLLDDIKDVGVLINNVGQSYDFPQYFHEISDEAASNLITMNITSTFVMTKLVLPGMVERKRGAIVNCSSGSARIPCPLLSEYSAAKKCLEQFSLGLAGEYASKNIAIQCQTPMFVTSKLSKIRHASFMAAVASIGYDTIVSPYWPHALQLYVFSLFPDFLVSKSWMAEPKLVTLHELKAAHRRSVCATESIAEQEISNMPSTNASSLQNKASFLQASVNEMCAGTYTHLFRHYFPTSGHDARKEEKAIDPKLLARMKELEEQIQTAEQSIKVYKSQLPLRIRDIIQADFDTKTKNALAGTKRKLPQESSSPSQLPDLTDVQTAFAQTTNKINMLKNQLPVTIQEATDTIRVIEHAIKKPKSNIDVLMQGAPTTSVSASLKSTVSTMLELS